MDTIDTHTVVGTQRGTNAVTWPTGAGTLVSNEMLRSADDQTPYMVTFVRGTPDLPTPGEVVFFTERDESGQLYSWTENVQVYENGNPRLGVYTEDTLDLIDVYDDLYGRVQLWVESEWDRLGGPRPATHHG